MRWRISFADLLVKVTQRIFPGRMPSSFTRKAKRWESALVLPEPAPAMTRTNPSVSVTAWRWAALRPESKSVIVASSLSNICFFHYIRTRRCSQPLLKNPSDLLWLRIGIRRTGKKDADIQINRRYRESLCRKSHLFQAKFTNHIFCLRKFFFGPYFSGITGI